MTKIKSISRSDKNSKYEDGFLEYDKYLEDIYPIALKTLCEALDSCNKERDRNMGLANAICDYFEKYKKYDFDYYNKVLQKNNNFFDEGDKSLYNRYDYNVNGIKKLGYHTPNDKKVILINNTMICDGCSQLVFDIIDYCNKHLGYNIHCDKISSINERHALNQLIINSKTYKFDMSKFSQHVIFEESKKNPNIHINHVTRGSIL